MEQIIKKLLCSINEDIANYKGDSLYEDGYIDSFQVIQLVAKLEEEFDIEIDPEKVIIDNFDSVAKIVSLVEECR